MKLTAPRLIGSAVIAGSLLLAGCSASSTPSGTDTPTDAEPFQVVAFIPTSGPLSAPLGLPVLKGLEITAEILNEHGGIDGRQIEVTSVDTAGDPATAVANVQAYLSSNPKPDLAYGGMVSAESVPLAPIFTQYEVLQLTSSVSPVLNDPAKFPYTFQTAIPAGDILQVMVEHLVDEGYKSVAFVSSDDESGHAQADAFEKATADAGIKATVGFTPAGSLDGTATLDALRATNPEALVFTGSGPTVSTILKARTSLQWTLPTFADSSASATDFGPISGPEDWVNVFMMNGKFAVAGTDVSDSEAEQDYIQRYREAVGGKIEGVTANALGSPYFLLLTAKAGYEASDSDDVQAVAEALEAIGAGPVPDSIADLWFGPSPLGFSPERHALKWTSKDFGFYPAGPQDDGFLVPSE